MGKWFQEFFAQVGVLVDVYDVGDKRKETIDNKAIRRMHEKITTDVVGIKILMFRVFLTNSNNIFTIYSWFLMNSAWSVKSQFLLSKPAAN